MVTLVAQNTLLYSSSMCAILCIALTAPSFRTLCTTWLTCNHFVYSPHTLTLIHATVVLKQEKRWKDRFQGQIFSILRAIHKQCLHGRGRGSSKVHIFTETLYRKMFHKVLGVKNLQEPAYPTALHSWFMDTPFCK